jgi:hypothetical protein
MPRFCYPPSGALTGTRKPLEIRPRIQALTEEFAPVIANLDSARDTLIELQGRIGYVISGPGQMVELKAQRLVAAAIAVGRLPIAKNPTPLLRSARADQAATPPGG